MKQLFTISALALLLISCGNNTNDKDDSLTFSGNGIAAPVDIPFTIVATHPHDTGAYTQGLQLHNGKMYEGTGDYENSSLRITDHKSGQVLQKHMIGGNDDLFGEGITILNNKIYQLTWQANVAYEYNLNDITKVVRTFKWPYEGWGITNDGKQLIISDGSNKLFFVNPETFQITNTLSVMSNAGPVDKLNELELINGFVYANIYTTTDIVKIDTASGHVVGKMTFNNLLTDKDFIQGHTDYFNGIAYDTATKTMFVTGKRWPKLFEVKLN